VTAVERTSYDYYDYYETQDYEALDYDKDPDEPSEGRFTRAIALGKRITLKCGSAGRKKCEFFQSKLAKICRPLCLGKVPKEISSVKATKSTAGTNGATA